MSNKKAVTFKSAPENEALKQQWMIEAVQANLAKEHPKAKPSPPDAIVPLDKGDMLYGKPGRYEIVRVNGQREFIRDGRTVRIIRPDGTEIVLHEVQETADANASA